LENALGNIKDLLGEKKFNARIKKTVKVFTEYIKKNSTITKKKASEATSKKKKTAKKVGIKVSNRHPG
jgi:hypothetical protein